MFVSLRTSSCSRTAPQLKEFFQGWGGDTAFQGATPLIPAPSPDEPWPPPDELWFTCLSLWKAEAFRSWKCHGPHHPALPEGPGSPLKLWKHQEGVLPKTPLAEAEFTLFTPSPRKKVEALSHPHRQSPKDWTRNLGS